MQQGFGVPQALYQGLNLIEVGLFPQQLGLFEVTRQRQLWRAQEVEDVAEITGTETGSVQAADDAVKLAAVRCGQEERREHCYIGLQVSPNAFWLS